MQDREQVIEVEITNTQGACLAVGRDTITVTIHGYRGSDSRKIER